MRQGFSRICLSFKVFITALPGIRSSLFSFRQNLLFCLYFPVSSLENKTIKNFLNQHGSSHNGKKGKEEKNRTTTTKTLAAVEERKNEASSEKSTSVNERKKQMDHSVVSFIAQCGARVGGEWKN